MSSAPVTLGRTLMYPVPRSEDFFGVMEMIPSPYTDSQYVSNDSTGHLPKYLGGRCRFSVSSNVAGLALFATTGDLRSLIVHEYTWGGDEKIQQAWHRWTFPYDIAAAYFASEVINILFIQNDVLVGASIDPRVGVLTFDSNRRPFMDLYTMLEITDNEVTIPDWFLTFDPEIADKLALHSAAGDLAGDRVGIASIAAPTITTVRSWDTGTVALGIEYRSSITPSPPQVRDANGVAMHTNKQTLLRYHLGTQNSSRFDVSVFDGRSVEAEETQVSPLMWSSTELALGRAKFAEDSVVVIPCRTEAHSSVVEFSTSGPGELNITSLEYVMRTHGKLQRR